MINNYDIDLNGSELSSSNNSIKKIQDYSIDINRDNNLNYRKKALILKKLFMTLTNIPSLYRKKTDDRILQGDIFKDIEIILGFQDLGEKKFEVTKRGFPFIIVLSQDCDLSEDYFNREIYEKKKFDKFLDTILICPAFPLDEFNNGTYLKYLGLPEVSKISFKEVKQNDKNKRFHYMTLDSTKGIPDLVIDFKRFYTIDRDVLYNFNKNYIGSLNELFRESLSQRFNNFLGRIGLPTFITECIKCENTYDRVYNEQEPYICRGCK